MLRKFQAFRSIYQFQLARIANDPRNQDGYGKNLGGKMKDSSNQSWDASKDKLNEQGNKRDFDLNKGSDRSTYDQKHPSSGVGEESRRDSGVKRTGSTFEQSMGSGYGQGRGAGAGSGSSSGMRSEPTQQSSHGLGLGVDSGKQMGVGTGPGASFGQGFGSQYTQQPSHISGGQSTAFTYKGGQATHGSSQASTGIRSQGISAGGVKGDTISFTQSSNPSSFDPLYNEKNPSSGSYGYVKDYVFSNKSGSSSQDQKGSSQGTSDFSQQRDRSSGDVQQKQGSGDENQSYTRWGTQGRDQDQNQNQDQSFTQKAGEKIQDMAQSVGQGVQNVASKIGVQDYTAKAGEKVQEYAQKVGDTVASGYQQVAEKVKDVTGNSSDSRQDKK